MADKIVTSFDKGTLYDEAVFVEAFSIICQDEDKAETHYGKSSGAKYDSSNWNKVLTRSTSEFYDTRMDLHVL